MAFDFKKEYKEFYMPKNKPEIVTVPKANYIAVRRSGDPNEANGAYQQAIGVLYAVAYTLKMSYKTDHQIAGFFESVVPPLEGFWWQDGKDGIDYANKSAFRWISVIRLPDFVTREDFVWAVETAAKKKPKIAIRTAPPMPTGICGRTPVRTIRTARQMTTTFMLIFLSVRSSLPPWPPASAFMESRKVVTIIGRDLMREMIPPVASAPAPM